MLDVWRAVARFSRNNGSWHWGGGSGSNSISNAEQLLCLMYPATEMGGVGLGLDVPDETAEDVLDALRALGDATQIPRLLVDVAADYMATYQSESGRPLFAGGSYFVSRDPEATLTAKQRELDIVDSFSLSISLCLSTLGFLKVFGRSVRRPSLREKVEDLESATSSRLSAAMVGLLRSFCVNVFEPDSDRGRELCTMINQSGGPDKEVLTHFRRRLKTVRASFRDATLGLTQDEALDNENMLFECGWSWGITRGAPAVETPESIGEQPEGVAPDVPSLYFTVTALDGITDLTSERTRVLGLLNTEQQRLAQALQLRWDLAKEYWSTIARFGLGERWPLEDVPWRTTDGEESVYFSLLMTALVIMDFLTRRANDDDVTRLVGVLEELAIRGRINRRMIKDDPAIEVHRPGVSLDLAGMDDLGPPATWVVADFATLLLKRCVHAAGLSRNAGARERLLNLADEALDHLWTRRHKTGTPVGLWDDASHFYEGADELQRPSWYITERVMESLVMAGRSTDQRPVRSPVLIEMTAHLLGEADLLFSKELIEASEGDGVVMHASLQTIQATIQRARRVLNERPGTANALALQVLRELDELAFARQDAARSM